MRLIIIISKVCGGKDTFARMLINHTPIDIGSIVREIKGQKERVHDKSLDREIMYKLKGILVNSSENFVVTGIRQFSILDYLRTYCTLNSIEYQCLYLTASDEELKRRWINRQDEKDKGLTFEEIIQRDHDLGLGEVEEFIKQNPQLFITIKTD